MLLKVLVYTYINNTYSSRKIEEALQQNIHFMWLSGINTPNQNTINRFRSDKLKGPLRNIFFQLFSLLAEEGLLSIKELYTDGTKIEANANRYTFVWGNSINTNKEKMKQQLDELCKYAQSVAADELDDTVPSGIDKIDSEKVKAFVKHNQFDREQNQTIQSKKLFTPEKLHYNKEKDYYVCPIGQHMKNIGTAI